MNPHEARHFRPDMADWPQWALRDFDIAYHAFRRVIGLPVERIEIRPTPMTFIRADGTTHNGI